MVVITSLARQSTAVVMGPGFRQDDAVGYILCIDTEIFGPFLMVW
jgi:hypothetical protein